MSISTLDQLLTTIQSLITTHNQTTTFNLPLGALSSTNVDKLVSGYLAPDSKVFTVDNPTEPTIVGQAVTFSGAVTDTLGVSGAITLEFDLQDQDQPSLLAVLPITDSNWNLGVSFPVWQDINSVLVKLKFTNPVLYFTSIARQAKGEQPALSNFVDITADNIDLSGVLGFLAQLPGAPQFSGFNGALQGSLTAPLIDLASSKTQSVGFGYLDLPLTLDAVSAPPGDDGKIQDPPPAFTTYLKLSSELQIPGTSAVPAIPVSMQFSRVGALLVFRANLAEISSYALSEFEGFVNQAPISSYLDQYLKIVEEIELKDLSVFIDTQEMSLDAVSIDIGTKNTLTIVKKYVVLDALDVVFMVNDPLGEKSITAVITGDFDFLDSVPVEVKGIFPQMIFSGGLKSDQPLSIQEIFKNFLPTVTDIPPIDIDNLFISADLTQETYSFQLAVSSEWKIPVGIAEIELQNAGLNLQHQTGQDGFTGEISATAIVFDQANTEFAELYMDWTLPGSFLLKGTFPVIPLSDLATKLTGGFLSNVSGLPTIDLENTIVQLTISQENSSLVAAQTGQTVYDFKAQTTIQADKIGEADLVFELRKGSSQQDGFITGLLVAPDWTPDALWSGLGSVFDVLTIKEAGLIFSSLATTDVSLDNFANLPYVPDELKVGITFFSALELKGETFSLIGNIFAEGVEFDLYAYIDTKDINNSDIKASLPSVKVNNAIQWKSLVIDMVPGQGEFSIQTGATFNIQGESLDLDGAGTITVLGDPSFTLGIAIATWKHPFGIEGLTIDQFGLTVTVAPGEFNIGLMGTFEIGEAPDQFIFKIGDEIVDFEAPGAFVFALDAKDECRPLELVDLIKDFTTIDLSEVPLLNGLAFKQIDFYVVDDPAGWTAPPPDNHHYPPGIGVNADIIFYDWEVKFFMQVIADKGIIASGNINQPIAIKNLLTVSDETGKLGPSAAINTSSLVSASTNNQADNVFLVTSEKYEALKPDIALAIRPAPPITILTESDNSYFTFTGGIDILGLVDIRFSGSAASDGFEVNFYEDLANIYRAQFMCTLSKTNAFKGSASGNFDFKHKFSNGLSISGIKIIPDGTRIVGPQASLSIDVAIDTSEAYLDLALKFHWGVASIDVQFKLDAMQIANLLANLWENIIQWIEDNAEKFLADIIASVDKFITWLTHEAKDLAIEVSTVAKFLYSYFKIHDSTELAKELVKIGIYSLNAMANALVELFDIDFNEAVKIVGESMDECALSTNQAFIYNVPVQEE